MNGYKNKDIRMAHEYKSIRMQEKGAKILIKSWFLTRECHLGFTVSTNHKFW